MTTLNETEIFALKAIFRNGGILALEILDQIPIATVIRRELTGPGFFTEIRLGCPIRTMPDLRMYEFNFRYPAFQHGGSFMCAIVAVDRIEIEAVSLGGELWPEKLEISSSEELAPLP